MLTDGKKVTEIRKHVKASNLVVGQVAKEYRLIGSKRTSAKHITNRGKPRGSIVQTGMRFGTKYRYHGEIHLWVKDEETGKESPYEIIPMYFGQDELLTGEQIRTWLEAKGEEIAERGGTGRQNRDYVEGLFVHHVVITSIQRSL